MSEPVDLTSLLLPAEWTLEELENEARRVYFQDLVPNPPKLAVLRGISDLPVVVTNTEGAFKHFFGESEGWASYHHQKTGRLDSERLRRVQWIRPVLEMRVKGIKIYVNNHSMKPRGYGRDEEIERKRIYVVTQKGLIYFASLKYLNIGKDSEHLVLTTAYEPDGGWLRDMLKKHGTICLFPPA